MQEFLANQTFQTAAATLAIAVMMYFAAVLQRMAARVRIMSDESKVAAIKLDKVSETSQKTEVLVNKQRSDLESKILLLEQRLDAALAIINAAATAKQAADAAALAQQSASLLAKDKHIAELASAITPPIPAL